VLAAGDVVVQGGAPPAPTGAELVRSAQLFAGLPYLWAGTSSSGFDCSGLTSAVYGAHGIVLPRDADDQAAAGTPVEPARLEPGDLLFYAYDGGRGAIHHVSMYVGDGLMIQSPSTGKTVETVPVDSAGFAGEFWGARRYLPPVAR
jgi:cell wall-associated NlpC family hydrolase